MVGIQRKSNSKNARRHWVSCLIKTISMELSLTYRESFILYLQDCKQNDQLVSIIKRVGANLEYNNKKLGKKTWNLMQHF